MLLSDLNLAARAAFRSAYRLLAGFLFLAIVAAQPWCGAAEVPVVFTAGNGTEGAFADRNLGYRFRPYELAHDVRSIAAGGAYLVYITNNGQLWGCGQNNLGQLGDGTNLHRDRPVLIATNVASAACGLDHLLFIKQDRSLWSTGANGAGQLGDGTIVDRNTPVQIATDVKAAAAGYAHTLVVKDDGSLWGCGDGSKGQLGAVAIAHQTTLVQMAGDVASVAADADFSLWIGTDGSLWGTGSNNYGQLGDGSVETKYAATQIMASGVGGIGAGSMHSLVIKSDGTLWAAGNNYSGQLGDGTIGTNRRTHVLVTSGIASAEGGFMSSYLVGTDGVRRVMGYNYFGNLGIDRSFGNPLRPFAAYDGVTKVAAGTEFSSFLTTGGVVWVTGRDDMGQLGDGLPSYRAAPTPVWGPVRTASTRFSSGLYIRPSGTLSWTIATREFAIDAAEVAGGGVHDLVITREGQLLGIDRSVPGLPLGTVQFSAIQNGAGSVTASSGLSHFMFVRQDGSLWAMGSNRYGELGDGSTTARSTPVKVADGVARVSVWSHSLFIKTDGSLWGTGRNASGQLGTGSTTDVSSPVQIATDVAWASAGGEFTLFVKTDGTLWGIGRNNHGQLGDGTRVDAPAPVRIAAGVSRAWGGWSHSAFLKSDGSLWTTGNNLYGQLGDGTFSDRLSPVKVAENVLWAEAGSFKTLFGRLASTPVVVVSPDSPATTAGGHVTLQANATGEGTPLFQWYRGTSGDVSDPVHGETAATLTTPPLTSASNFWVRVTNFAGSTDSSTATVAIIGPSIHAHPKGEVVTAGGALTLSVEAASSVGQLSYQWYRDGVEIDGATGATLTLPSVQAFHAGRYTVVVSSGGHSLTSEAAVVGVSAAPPSTARLLNLSTRALALSGDDLLIPGFVINGAGTKRLLIRGVGPTLGVLGVSNTLADPRVTVKRGDTTVAFNDDWGTNANAAEIVATSAAVGAFALVEGSRDAALLVDLGPGAYTVPTEGAGGGTGVALVELYDADPSTGSGLANLVNISNRGFVGVGDAVMIPGIVVSNEGSRTLLVRAVGPTLGSFGVSGVLADPGLGIYRRLAGDPPTEQLILGNDDWDGIAGSTMTATVAAAVGAFALEPASKDAAFVVTLPPGVYTVQATGVGDTTGVALVEVYLVP